MKKQFLVSRSRARALVRLCLPLIALAVAGTAAAEVRIDEPWARATVAGQQASGAFMTITSTQDARLVAVQTPIAGVAEIHEMALENNVMRMRRIDGLELPAGKAVELRPGGYHLMLLDLKGALNTGESVDLTLTVEGADGKRERIDVKAPIRPLTAGHGHGHGQDHGAKTHGH